MANTNSNLAAAQAAVETSPRSTIDGKDIGGILLIARGQVTIPATPSVDDTLTLLAAGQVPKGAVIEPLLSNVYFETDPGTALTLDVGNTSNPDAFADALACNAAGAVNFGASATVPSGITDPAEETGEAILATVKVSTSVVETVMQFQIAYRVAG